MSFAEIQAGLTEEWARVNSTTLVDELPTAYENVEFEHPNGTPWAAVFMLASPSNVGSLGDNGDDEFSGIFQIDLMYPLGEGIFRVNEAIDLIREEFKAGKYLTYSGGTQYVLINACSPAIRQKEDSFYRATISVEWETRINR